MTEKTVRPHSVLRRTMLVGTAGVLGGAVLRPAPVQSQTGTAPAAAVPGSAPPAARYGDPAWWAQRKEEILEPALEIVDPHHHLWDRKRAPLPARPVARRHRQRSQHHAKRLCRMRLDVPCRWAGGDEAGRRNRIRERHGGDERERTISARAGCAPVLSGTPTCASATAWRACWRRRSRPATAASAAFAIRWSGIPAKCSRAAARTRRRARWPMRPGGPGLPGWRR